LREERGKIPKDVIAKSDYPSIETIAVADSKSLLNSSLVDPPPLKGFIRLKPRTQIWDLGNPFSDD
jgi:hypothetical protein